MSLDKTIRLFPKRLLELTHTHRFACQRRVHNSGSKGSHVVLSQQWKQAHASMAHVQAGVSSLQGLYRGWCVSCFAMVLCSPLSPSTPCRHEQAYACLPLRAWPRLRPTCRSSSHTWLSIRVGQKIHCGAVLLRSALTPPSLFVHT